MESLEVLYNVAMSRWWIAPAGVALVLIFAAPAGAKDGATVRLTTDVPLDAAPGTMLRLAWTMRTPDGDPFSALPVFVRLHGTDGASTTATANEEGGYGSGAYSARARVPKGGIDRIEIGLRGIGAEGATEGLFEIENLPAGLGAGGEAPVSRRAGLLGFAAAAGAAALLLLRRRHTRPAVAAR